MKTAVELFFALACLVMGGYDVASANTGPAIVLFLCASLIGLYTIYELAHGKYGSLTTPNLIVGYYSAFMIGYDYYHKGNSIWYVFLLMLCCVSIVGILVKSKHSSSKEEE